MLSRFFVEYLGSINETSVIQKPSTIGLYCLSQHTLNNATTNNFLNLSGYFCIRDATRLKMREKPCSAVDI